MSDKTKLTETHVDLGSDLIRTTRELTSPEPPQVQSHQEIESDRFQSAKILLEEGFREDAKRELRQILVQNPSHGPARALLQTTLDAELQELLSPNQGPTHSRVFSAPTDMTPPTPKQVRETLEKLEEDLDMELLFESDPKRGHAHALSLFGDERAIQAYSQEMEKTLVDVNPEQRLDLGIGFLEMELFDLAIRNFKVAARESELQVQATALLARAQLESGNAFEALLAIEPLLTDSEVDLDLKVELFYLAGRASEEMSNGAAARSWYRQTLELDGDYRDTQERLTALETLNKKR